MKPLIDKFGHRHSEDVLRHWSLGILKALEIRCADPDANRNSATRRTPATATGQLADQTHAPAQAVASAKD